MFGLQWLRRSVVNGRMLHGVVRQGHRTVGGERGRRRWQGKRTFDGTRNPATVTSRNNQKKSSIEERSRPLPSSQGFPRPAATLFP